MRINLNMWLDMFEAEAMVLRKDFKNYKRGLITLQELAATIGNLAITLDNLVEYITYDKEREDSNILNTIQNIMKSNKQS